MMVQVLLFAHARQIVGSESTEVEISDSSATVANLKNKLGDKHPELAALLSRSNIAINQQYATDTDTIAADAEVAMIPPVSGG